MKWQIQIPFRKIKKAMETAQSGLSSCDFSHLALFNEQGQLIHITGPNALHYFGISQSVGSIKGILKLGVNDIVVTNDPSCGSPRLCDLSFIKAIHHKNIIRGYAVIQVNLSQLLHSDHIFKATSNNDEGYKIPPTPLDSTGQVEAALFDYLNQSKINRDLLQKVFSEVKEAFKKLDPLFLQIQPQELKELNTYTEELLKKSLERFPDGEYSHLNKDLNVKLKVKQHLCSVQFPNAPKEGTHNKNCNYFVTASSCLWFFLSLIEEEIPINEGTLRGISIEAPQGSVVNCSTSKATLFGYYLVTNQIIEGLFEIYKKLFKQEAQNLFFSPSTFLILKSAQTLCVKPFGQGKNAGAHSDGISVIISDCHNLNGFTDEMMENHCPIEIQSDLLHTLPDEEASFSGGAGLRLELKFTQDAEICLFRNFSGKSKQPSNLLKTYKVGESVLIQTPSGAHTISTEV